MTGAEGGSTDLIRLGALFLKFPRPNQLFSGTSQGSSDNSDKDITEKTHLNNNNRVLDMYHHPPKPPFQISCRPCMYACLGYLQPGVEISRRRSQSHSKLRALWPQDELCFMTHFAAYGSHQLVGIEFLQ